MGVLVALPVEVKPLLGGGVFHVPPVREEVNAHPVVTDAGY